MFSGLFVEKKNIICEPAKKEPENLSKANMMKLQVTITLPNVKPVAIVEYVLRTDMHLSKNSVHLKANLEESICIFQALCYINCKNVERIELSIQNHAFCVGSLIDKMDLKQNHEMR